MLKARAARVVPWSAATMLQKPGPLSGLAYPVPTPFLRVFRLFVFIFWNPKIKAIGSVPQGIKGYAHMVCIDIDISTIVIRPAQFNSQCHVNTYGFIAVIYYAIDCSSMPTTAPRLLIKTYGDHQRLQHTTSRSSHHQNSTRFLKLNRNSREYSIVHLIFYSSHIF